MKYYNVEVLYKGKRETFLVQSSNKKEALEKAKLKANGVVLRIEETSEPLEIKLQVIKQFFSNIRKGKIRRDHLIATIRQLAVMTNAGIPIHDALIEIAHATKNEQLKQILLAASDDINAGISFSKALEKYVDQIGTLTITLVRLGEQTGDMAYALNTLATILEQIDENIRKFKKAIRYPLITLGAMAIAFIVLITYVVPKFKAIFEKFQAELPLPTRILLQLEHFFNTYGLLLIIGAISGLALFIYLYKRNRDFQYTVDAFALKLYLIKNIIYYGQLSRFMLIFSELIKAGIPVVDALENSIVMVDNAVIRKKLSRVITMVEKGSSIADAFAETELFENMIIQMISAGEAGGQLDTMLEKITNYYDMKFNYILDNLSSYIEPILLAIIAGLVLLLALGIFLPMWDMAKVIGMQH